MHLTIGRAETPSIIRVTVRLKPDVLDRHDVKSQSREDGQDVREEVRAVGTWTIQWLERDRIGCNVCVPERRDLPLRPLTQNVEERHAAGEGVGDLAVPRPTNLIVEEAADEVQLVGHNGPAVDLNVPLIIIVLRLAIFLRLCRLRTWEAFNFACLQSRGIEHPVVDLEANVRR